MALPEIGPHPGGGWKSDFARRGPRGALARVSGNKQPWAMGLGNWPHRTTQGPARAGPKAPRTFQSLGSKAGLIFDSLEAELG